MKYTAIVTKEGHHWLATFPDCLGNQTFAEDLDDLAIEAKEALDGWLEGNLILGILPPMPCEHSGSHLLHVDVEPRLVKRLQHARSEREVEARTRIR